MGKRVLGNDPFLRGAATREPGTVVPIRPAAAGAPEARVAAAAEPRNEVVELPASVATVEARPEAGDAGGEGSAAAGATAARVEVPAANAKAAAVEPAQAAARSPAVEPAQAAAKEPAVESQVAAAKEASVEPAAKDPAVEPAAKAGVRPISVHDFPLPPPKRLPREKRPATPPTRSDRGAGKAPAKRRQALPHSPLDRLSDDVVAPVRDRPSRSRAVAEDAGDLAADGGLLPADLAAVPPAPRVVAVAPLPEARPPAPAQFVAIVRSGPATAADAARGFAAILRRAAHLDSTFPSVEVDEFGRDPAFEARVRPLLAWMYRQYFRVDEYGFDKLPRTGPLILVANRAGAIPWDAAMIGIAAGRHGREVRPLLEDAVSHFPFLGVILSRLGAVRACPENAERILGPGGAVTVFPEGAGGFAKPFRDRYRVQRFGRGGFVRLALRTGATIVPVAVVGSEETYPLLGRVPARLLGIPFLPITPTWPWLGAAGLWPLPSKWTIELGEPVDLTGLGPDDANDDGKVMRIAESIRATVQAMLDARLADRRSVFGG